jgi:hypothetical protein
MMLFYDQNLFHGGSKAGGRAKERRKQGEGRAKPEAGNVVQFAHYQGFDFDEVQLSNN